jgi:hypothetical protein
MNIALSESAKYERGMAALDDDLNKKEFFPLHALTSEEPLG